MPSRRALCLAGALACLTGSAHAVTVSETVVGDFDTTNDFSLVTDTIGILGLGLNTVSGSISDACVPNTPSGFICIDTGDHTDAFRLGVGSRQRIVSVRLTTAGSAPAGYAPSYGMVDLATLTFVHTDGFADFNATRPIIDGVPVGSGNYVFGVGQGLADAAGPVAYDWTVEFQVAPVPLPAGALLVVSGLALLAAARLPAAS